MYIAMNRFKIKNGNEKDFENLWRNRETFLDKVEGFKKFNLIKGEKFEDYTLYASHSTWSSKDLNCWWEWLPRTKSVHATSTNHISLQAIPTV